MNDTQTTIGEMTERGYALRGVLLEELAKASDPLSAAWLAWTGAQLTPEQKIVLNACIIMSLDHGSGPPSAQATRLVASCGKPMADAVAAGLLTLGPRHGNAGSLAAQILRTAVLGGKTAESLVQEVLARGERIPGFGHPVYEKDPRAEALVLLVKSQLSKTVHVDFAVTVATALATAKQKPVPLNIDGAIGAIIADLGVPDILADVIFLWSRVAGLAAHAIEASAQPSYNR